MTEPELRDKDRLVLQQIKKGNDDVQKITAATTLENHHVTYAFHKLEDFGLINVEKPDGMVERLIDGQKRVFQHPKLAELTGKGEQHLKQSDPPDVDAYENLSHRELVEKTHRLENELQDLEQSFETFRKQITRKLE